MLDCTCNGFLFGSRVTVSTRSLGFVLLEPHYRKEESIEVRLHDSGRKGRRLGQHVQ
jgi:hypothetical protein